MWSDSKTWTHALHYYAYLELNLTNAIKMAKLRVANAGKPCTPTKQAMPAGFCAIKKTKLRGLKNW